MCQRYLIYNEKTIRGEKQNTWRGLDEQKCMIGGGQTNVTRILNFGLNTNMNIFVMENFTEYEY